SAAVAPPAAAPPAAAAAAAADPFALTDDGAAVDPAAFQAALMADPARMAAVAALPGSEAHMAVLAGPDLGALQRLLREAMQAEGSRLERQARRWAERTVDAQRASAPVPRDTVHVYKQLAEAGLEYGPAFRLLRNVHVPLPAE
ncbi:hypothetical protein TSOC_010498, partial [Tetrabaena socialis]